ncbi:secreted protein [methanotrophic bacterial endosymbiont of Bathymodiolus sp.]|nr:secreted protein [methanotrophic bacterial endosymbiont of Bathymodiolus sp.]
MYNRLVPLLLLLFLLLVVLLLLKKERLHLFLNNFPYYLQQAPR